MASTLFVHGRIYSPTEPFADSFLVEDGAVRWIGQSEAAHHSGIQSVDLEGALVTPGFVDAHVHMTTAGMQLISLDLSSTLSASHLLQQLETYARIAKGAPLIGHGWDESRWSDQTLPSIAQIDRATFGSVVYLSRIDVHSALVSSTALLLAPEARALNGWSESGFIRAQAHGALRTRLHQEAGGALGEKARDAFIDHCYAHGVTSIHECGGPEIGGEADFLAVRRSCQKRGMDLVAYWGELGGFQRAQALQADGVGGDLFIDGSLGSHTAALLDPYADHKDRGVLYLDSESILGHIKEGNRLGIQVGFHAIGDRALQAFTEALSQINPNESRSLRHRVEHAEMLDPSDLALWRSHGVVLSVQPLFDDDWAKNLYPQRLGAERASRLNPFNTLIKSGLSLALSSDAPVTRSSPWEWIRACVFHHNPSERISARAAFNAATRGGRRAAHQDHAGTLEVGAKADFAIWKVGDYSVQTPDPRVAAWSTDERAGVAELPTLTSDGELPECISTYINGELKYQRD